MNNILILCTLLLSTPALSSYTVHEWGTFTSMIGSNGKAQDGMIGEDELLPDFVYNFGAANWPGPNSLKAAHPFPLPTPRSGSDRGCNGPVKVPCEFLLGQVITQKMETPVVYFYSDEPRSVQFEVEFPAGIISQSFPAPESSRPEAIAGTQLKQGYANYQVDILARNTKLQPPYVNPQNIYSHARNTESNLIQAKTSEEVEKFIFYRGIGDFTPALKPTSRDGSMTIKNLSLDEINQVFLVYTNKDRRGSIIRLNKVGAHQHIKVSSKTIHNLKKSISSEGFIQKARTLLTSALTSNGLYHDEAISMIDTWEHGYFQTPGLRILYLLSRKEADHLLPVKITPEPASFERAFVGRLEILLDTDEEKIYQEVLKQQEDFPIQNLGRLALPILERIQEIAKERGTLDRELLRVLKELKEKL